MRRLCVLFAAIMLSACMTMPKAPEGGHSASGRISIRSGSDSHYANFEWESAPDGDRIALNNPLGQTVAQLQISYAGNVASHAVLRQSDGQSRSADEPDALLAEATGIRLPVSGLRWWLQGLPAPGDAREEATETGRRIFQDGWQIDVSQFSEPAPGHHVPGKLELRRDDLVVRIVISEWQWQTSKQP
jgi:outer membrane lipoprotein LolB